MSKVSTQPFAAYTQNSISAHRAYESIFIAMPSGKGDPVKSFLESESPQRLQKHQARKTLNRTGYQFEKLHPSLDHWIHSCPESAHPLLDLGCAFGVHTLHAIKHGRDVVALDMEKGHLDVLNTTAAQLTATARPEDKYGKLVQSIVSTMPCGDVFGKHTFSGVLLSEVVHCLKLNEPEVVMRDVFKWLIPGGKLVVTIASCEHIEKFVTIGGFVCNGGRSIEETLEIIATEPDNITELAPGYIELPPDSPLREHVLGHLYTMTPKEIATFAERAGFQVLEARLFSPGKYVALPEDARNESVLMVARKPE